MDDKLIVALDFSENNLAVAVAQKSSSGLLSLIDYKEKTVAAMARNGVILNPNNALLEMNAVFSEIEQSSGKKIGGFYFGLEPYTLLSEVQTVSAEKDSTKTPPVQLKELIEMQSASDESEKVLFSTEELSLSVEPQRVSGTFINIYLKDTVKTQVDKIIGNFSSRYEVRYAISPDVEAEILLSDEQKRQGCLLIDFGVEVTSFVLYKNSVKKLLAVVPFGGRHITQDLSQRFDVNFEIAEKMKKQFGTAAVDFVDDFKSYSVPNRDKQKIPVNPTDAAEVIEARLCETMKFIQQEIDSCGLTNEYSEIVIVGGGAEMKSITDLIEKLTGKHVEKGVSPTLEVGGKKMDNTLLFSLLMSAKEDCSKAIAIKKQEPEPKPEPVQEPKQEPEKKPEPVQEPKQKKKRRGFDLAGLVGGLFDDKKDNSI